MSVSVNGAFALSFALQRAGRRRRARRAVARRHDLGRQLPHEDERRRLRGHAVGLGRRRRRSPRAPPGAGATATLTLTLSQAAATATSVAWTTVDGTGLAGADYVAASGHRDVRGRRDDGADHGVRCSATRSREADETFYVALSSPTGLDDRPRRRRGDDRQRRRRPSPALSIGNVDASPRANTSTTVTRDGHALVGRYDDASPSSTRPSNGTALAGSDYTATSGTLTFAAGPDLEDVHGHDPRRQDEGVDRGVQRHALERRSAPTLANGTGTVTIVDNDGALTAAAAPSRHRIAGAADAVGARSGGRRRRGGLAGRPIRTPTSAASRSRSATCPGCSSGSRTGWRSRSTRPPQAGAGRRPARAHGSPHGRPARARPRARPRPRGRRADGGDARGGRDPFCSRPPTTPSRQERADRLPATEAQRRGRSR